MLIGIKNAKLYRLTVRDLRAPDILSILSPILSTFLIAASASSSFTEDSTTREYCVGLLGMADTRAEISSSWGAETGAETGEEAKSSKAASNSSSTVSVTSTGALVTETSTGVRSKTGISIFSLLVERVEFVDLPDRASTSRIVSGMLWTENTCG